MARAAIQGASWTLRLARNADMPMATAKTATTSPSTPKKAMAMTS